MQPILAPIPRRWQATATCCLVASAAQLNAFSLAESLKNSTVPQFQDAFGWALYKRGDYGNSVSTLEAARSKLPNLASVSSVHYYLGMSYKAASQPEKATEQFNAALSLEPDGPLKENILVAMK